MPLKPVVSDVIVDKQSIEASDLEILEISECSSSVEGGNKVILLCDRVNKKDIQVRFYEEVDDVVVWEQYGIFEASHVHRQVAISFKTPPYRDLNISEPVILWMQLYRPSDGEKSEPIPFLYAPKVYAAIREKFKRVFSFDEQFRELEKAYKSRFGNNEILVQLTDENSSQNNESSPATIS